MTLDYQLLTFIIDIWLLWNQFDNVCISIRYQLDVIDNQINGEAALFLIFYHLKGMCYNVCNMNNMKGTKKYAEFQ